MRICQGRINHSADLSRLSSLLYRWPCVEHQTRKLGTTQTPTTQTRKGRLYSVSYLTCNHLSLTLALVLSGDEWWLLNHLPISSRTLWNALFFMYRRSQRVLMRFCYLQYAIYMTLSLCSARNGAEICSLHLVQTLFWPWCLIHILWPSVNDFCL